MSVVVIACDSARELVSAGVDDELTSDEQLALDEHLGTCAACSLYAEQVSVFTRSLRLRPVTVGTDLSSQVLSQSSPPRLGRGGWMRPALAWVGIVVAVESFGPLVFGEMDGTPTHVARHVGASGLALAIGLMYAAWRPHRAFGLLPLVGALLAATVGAALLDTISGSRSGPSELMHLSELVGMVLLWFVAGSPGWERVSHAISSIRRGGGVPHATS